MAPGSQKHASKCTWDFVSQMRATFVKTHAHTNKHTTTTKTYCTCASTQNPCTHKHKHKNKQTNTQFQSWCFRSGFMSKKYPEWIFRMVSLFWFWLCVPQICAEVVIQLAANINPHFTRINTCNRLPWNNHTRWKEKRREKEREETKTSEKWNMPLWCGF